MYCGRWTLNAALFLAIGSVALGQESHDKRAFGIVPNLNTLSATDRVAPWTAKQKYKQAASDSFDRSAFLVTGVLAGISQLENQFPGYGQGIEGYAKRFGSSFGDRTIGIYMTRAVLPAALHQDPRYFRLGAGSYPRRFGYAITRTLIARNDNGSNGFNYSEIGGYAASAALSNVYYPAASRTATNAAQNWVLQIGADAGFNVLKEFWPDIEKKFFK